MKFSNGSFLKLGETLETMKNRDLRKYTMQAHDRYSSKEIAMEVSSRKLNLTWDTMLAEGTYEELWDMYRGDGEPGLADAMGMSERQFAKAYTAAGENIKKMIQNYLSKNVDETFEVNPNAGHRDQMAHPENQMGTGPGIKTKPKLRPANLGNKFPKTKPKLRPDNLGTKPKLRPDNLGEAGGYYTQPVYDMIKQHGIEKVMHELLTSLDSDAIQSFLSRVNFDEARSSASDQAAAAGAYNGGKSIGNTGNKKPGLQGKELADHRAKRSAEYDVELDAARKANRDRLASYKTEAIDTVLASANGYSVVKDDGDDIHVMYNGSIIGSASFDGGSDSFWVSTGEAGQESFNTAQDIIDYYAQNKITESSDSNPASILAKYPKEYAALKAGADILDFDDLYYELYVYFVDSGDMPYGTQKARDGDPYEWIQDELDNLGLLEVASVIPTASKVKSQPTQHSLNELDMLAKNIDYIKGADGNYYKVSYRNTGTVTGGGHRQNDKANFVDVQPAGSKEIEALGLDGRLAQPGMNKNQVHIGHDIQGGTPFSDEDISVYAMDTDEYEKGVPTGVKTQLLRYMTQKEDSRINANRIEERVKWLANKKK